jgi:hypothetical protein
MTGLTLVFAVLRFPPSDNGRTEARVMILVRFAISVFALALLGMALSLSAARSQQASHAPAAVTLR